MHWYLSQLSTFHEKVALASSSEESYRYSDLLSRSQEWVDEFRTQNCVAGSVVVLDADYSVASVAFLLACIECKVILVPFRQQSGLDRAEVSKIVQATHLVSFNEGRPLWTGGERLDAPRNVLIKALQDKGHGGLVVFTSGSTGVPKGILYDVEDVLEKFRGAKKPSVSMLFLMFDHFGGLNTLLGILSSGGTAVLTTSRNPEEVARSIARHHVEVLPVSPTFLRMFLLADCHRRFDCSSLRLITYGTEPMPSSLLRDVAEAFPNVRLKQTYGLSELGVFATQSESSTSLKIRISNDVGTRVVDGILWIRNPRGMLGYLNAPSPFDAEGWFCTGDEVEVGADGYLTILGRKSELINVGGEKVYPVEVESVLLEDPNVRDAHVFGKKNPLTGSVVVATVVLGTSEDAAVVENRLRSLCSSRLASFKVPSIVRVKDELEVSARFKKKRIQEGA